MLTKDLKRLKFHIVWLLAADGGFVVLLENKTRGLSLGLENEWSEPDENM